MVGKERFLYYRGHLAPALMLSPLRKGWDLGPTAGPEYVLPTALIVEIQVLIGGYRAMPLFEAGTHTAALVEAPVSQRVQQLPQARSHGDQNRCGTV